MGEKYTAADFANAQFAKHPDGRIAMRSAEGQHSQWRCEAKPEWDTPANVTFANDGTMARFGWVPVPTKPTITDSEVGDIAKDQSDDWLLGFITGYEKAGGTVLEETTRERVARLVNEIISNRGPAFIGEKVADRLISLELVKDN